jgi:hypothetical protein
MRTGQGVQGDCGHGTQAGRASLKVYSAPYFRRSMPMRRPIGNGSSRAWPPRQPNSVIGSRWRRRLVAERPPRGSMGETVSALQSHHEEASLRWQKGPWREGVRCRIRLASTSEIFFEGHLLPGRFLGNRPELSLIQQSPAFSAGLARNCAEPKRKESQTAQTEVC